MTPRERQLATIRRDITDRIALDARGDDPPIFCLGDDFASQRGLMVSPERWRRFLKPHYAKRFVPDVSVENPLALFDTAREYMERIGQ